MAAAAAGIQPFRLELAGLELFPTARDPRVISLAIRGAVPTLTQVYEQITRELRARDFEVSDKPFRAHVTLARIKSMKGLSGLRDVVKSHAQYKAASFTAEGIAFYSSMLSPAGPSYTLLKFQPFEAGD
jgi:2'-5' RNA ligase